MIDSFYDEMVEYGVHLTTEEWLEIRKDLKPVVYKKGSAIFPSTERCTDLIYLVDGIAASEYFDEDERVISRFFVQRNFASNVVSLLTNKIVNDHVFAVTDVRAILIPGQLFLDSYLYSYHMGLYLRKKLLENLLEAKMFISIKTVNGVDKKLDFLKDNYPEIILNVPWKYIANFLGVTPEWLSRTLKRRKSGNTL